MWSRTIILWPWLSNRLVSVQENVINGQRALHGRRPLPKPSLRRRRRPSPPSPRRRSEPGHVAAANPRPSSLDSSPGSCNYTLRFSSLGFDLHGRLCELLFLSIYEFWAIGVCYCCNLDGKLVFLLLYRLLEPRKLWPLAWNVLKLVKCTGFEMEKWRGFGSCMRKLHWEVIWGTSGLSELVIAVVWSDKVGSFGCLVSFYTWPM